MKYTKTFLFGYAFGFPFHFIRLGLQGMTAISPLQHDKALTTGDYTKATMIGKSFKILKIYSGLAFSTAAFITTFRIVMNTFERWGYTYNHSIFNTSMLFAPIFVALKYDGFTTFFWPKALMSGVAFCINLYLF